MRGHRLVRRQQLAQFRAHGRVVAAGVIKKGITIFRRVVQRSGKKIFCLIWRWRSHGRIHFTPSCENGK